jgi:hypothetical protein
MLTVAQKAAWIAKLRDPNSKQAFNLFRAFNGGCCALGWLTDSLGWYDHGESSSLLYINQRKEIQYMNDIDRMPLPEIADWIEANVPCSD